MEVITIPVVRVLFKLSNRKPKFDSIVEDGVERIEQSEFNSAAAHKYGAFLATPYLKNSKNGRPVKTTWIKLGSEMTTQAWYQTPGFERTALYDNMFVRFKNDNLARFDEWVETWLKSTKAKLVKLTGNGGMFTTTPMYEHIKETTHWGAKNYVKAVKLAAIGIAHSSITTTIRIQVLDKNKSGFGDGQSYMTADCFRKLFPDVKSNFFKIASKHLKGQVLVCNHGYDADVVCDQNASPLAVGVHEVTTEHLGIHKTAIEQYGETGGIGRQALRSTVAIAKHIIKAIAERTKYVHRLLIDIFGEDNKRAILALARLQQIERIGNREEESLSQSDQQEILARSDLARLMMEAGIHPCYPIIMNSILMSTRSALNHWVLKLVGKCHRGPAFYHREIPMGTVWINPAHTYSKEYVLVGKHPITTGFGCRVMKIVKDHRCPKYAIGVNDKDIKMFLSDYDGDCLILVNPNDFGIANIETLPKCDWVDIDTQSMKGKGDDNPIDDCLLAERQRQVVSIGDNLVSIVNFASLLGCNDVKKRDKEIMDAGLLLEAIMKSCKGNNIDFSAPIELRKGWVKKEYGDDIYNNAVLITAGIGSGNYKGKASGFIDGIRNMVKSINKNRAISLISASLIKLANFLKEMTEVKVSYNFGHLNVEKNVNLIAGRYMSAIKRLSQKDGDSFTVKSKKELMDIISEYLDLNCIEKPVTMSVLRKLHALQAALLKRGSRTTMPLLKILELSNNETTLKSITALFKFR